MNRLQQPFNGQEVIACSLQFRIGAGYEILGILDKTEKTEPFTQFHARTGLGLLRGAAFSHLFFVADDFPGVLACDAEINGDIKPAVINAPDFFQDFQIDFGKAFLKTPDGLYRGKHLVLVIGICLVTIL